MKRLASDRKIVWAVDPYCENCVLVKQTARSVAVLASQLRASIQPVFLLRGFPPNVRLLPRLIGDVQVNAQKELRRLVKGVKFTDLLPLHVLATPSSQLRTDVDRLVDYAKRSDADFIAVGTRARSGLKRWILGSFAETLILRSDVPLYVIHPDDAKPKRIQHILFPTDFSKESKQAFDQIVEFSKEIRAEVTLFHKISFELSASLDAAFSAYPAFREYLEEEAFDRQQEARSWSEPAKASGARINILVDYFTNRSASDAILQASQRRGGMIAMAAHSGPVASALLGSVTRHTVRNARCPVWVIHTEQKNAEAPFTITEEEIIADLEGHGHKRGVVRRLSEAREKKRA